MKLVCIKCPRGCELNIDGDNITGNQCLRGIDYAKEELTTPKRIVTALLKTEKGVVPVKTNGEIPKGKITDVVNEINKLYVKSTQIGDVVIKNCLGLNVDIIVTGDICK